MVSIASVPQGDCLACFALHIRPEVGCILASILHRDVRAARMTTLFLNEVGDVVHNAVDHHPRILDHLVALDFGPANQAQRVVIRRLCAAACRGGVDMQMLRQLAQTASRHPRPFLNLACGCVASSSLDHSTRELAVTRVRAALAVHASSRAPPARRRARAGVEPYVFYECARFTMLMLAAPRVCPGLAAFGSADRANVLPA